MINKDEELGFITGEDGKETPIHVIDEFTREEDGKRFVIYTDIEDPKDENEEREYFVAEIVTLEDGSQELADVESEEDLAYCQEVFDSILDEVMANEMSDTEDDEIEEDEETLKS